MSAVTDLIAGIFGGLGKTAIDVRTAITGKDPAAEAKIQELIVQIDAQRTAAVLAVDQGQIEINKIEATKGSFFDSGWRPAIGWIGALSLAITYWPRAIVTLILWAHTVRATGALTLPPDLGLEDLIALLGSILGIGTMRSLDKSSMLKALK